MIAKTEEVVEKDLQIQEQEQKIEAIQTKMQKVPKQDLIQKLGFYKQSLKDKTKQLMVRKTNSSILLE